MAETQLGSLRLGGVDAEKQEQENKKPTLIHVLDGQSDALLGDSKTFYDENHYEGLDQESFDFKELKKSKIAKYLTDKNRIIIPVDDGFFREFIIEEVNQTREGFEVYTLASYIELRNDEPIEPTTLEGATVNTAMDYILARSGWQRGITEYAGTRTITFDDYINPFNALKQISNADMFDLEMRFRIETKNGKVTGRFVDMIKRIGTSRGKEIESGKDLISARRIENSGDVVTALYGLGPIKEDGTREVVIVKNEKARQIWGRDGRHLWDIYEPMTTDLEMTRDRLTTLTETELQKRISAKVTWEVEAVSIEHIFGREHEKVRLGDDARIKATDYTPPIYLDSRIIAREGPIRDKSQRKYYLGEFVEYSEHDIGSIRKEFQKRIAQKISAAEAEAKIIERTYDKATIDDKDESVRTDVESYADTVSNDAKEEANTYTNNTVEPIQVAVDDLEIEQSNLTERVTTAETEISQAWDEINLKAESTIVDEIEGRVTTAEQSINGLEGSITSKVEQTTFNTLEGRVDTAESTISQQATQIQSKIDDGEARSIFTQEASSFTFEANQINFDGHVFGTNATFDGHLEGATGTFSGDIKTPLFVVEAEDIKRFNEFGFAIQMAQVQESLDEPYKETGYLHMNTLNDVFEIYKTDSLHGNPAYLKGFQVTADLSSFYGKMRVTEERSNFDYPVFEVGKFVGWENHFVLKRSSAYNAVWDINLANGHLNFEYKGLYGTEQNRLMIIENDGVLTVDGAMIKSSTGNTFNIGVSNFARITDAGGHVNNDSYKPLYAQEFNSVSTADTKYYIEAIEKDALSIINQATVYQYYQNSDPYQEHLKFGFVIGEGYNTPSEFIAGNGEAIDHYKAIAISIKGIQELDDKFASVVIDIDFLKEEYQTLERRLSKLEGLMNAI